VPDRFPHPRSNRLLKRREFDQVFKLGSKQVGRHFVCYTVRREEPGNKLGMVVSRKVGKAVTRNRVKRYIRECFRLHQGRFEMAVELVVVARAEAAKLDSAACERSLRQLLERGGVIRG
jgi:ribonuclease P protein component